MDFNPNKPGLTKNYFWATYIPDRHPKFKMYSNLGHAKNAFQYRDEGILYEWNKETEQWEEVFRLERGRDHTISECEDCGGSLMRKYYHDGGLRKVTYHKWYGIERKTICSNCHRK